MKPVLLLNVVGLTPGMIPSEAPRLGALAREGCFAPMRAALPAVTCTSQATMVTGRMPRDHGIVANGWYFRDLNEVWLWRQSGSLIEGPKIWDEARRRDPSFTCANLFWWYNMNTTCDLGVTPRPTYPADGSKIFGVYSYPHDLGKELVAELGEFPFHTFWGPTAGSGATEWIAKASAQVIRKRRPTLALVYLPHLDYDFLRYGSSDPRARAAIAEVDRVAGDLVDAARAEGYAVLVVSEYGLTDVKRPVHLNRVLREAGLLTALETAAGWELLDFGLSRAFAVADHQVAHVYVRDPADVPRVQSLLREVPGVEDVLGADGKAAAAIDHPRAGELVAVSEADAWFTYYYWLDDGRAPDFARTVDIHRKPGFDPAELFFDPHRPLVKLAAGFRLAQKTLGFRYLMDVVGLDASIVGGSHGRISGRPEDGPVVLCPERPEIADDFAMTDVFGLTLELLERS